MSFFLVQVVLAAPPAPDFTISDSSPDVNETVNFNASSTTDPDDDDITTYEWDFDYDGTFQQQATGVTASHSYGAAGPYSVALRVTDAAAETAVSVKSVNVSVPNTNPTATNITFAPVPPNNGNAAYVGQSIALSGSGSDADGDPITYEWNFGDGQTAVGKNVTHAYSSRGEKDVTLTVRDNRGGTGTHEEPITINGLPVADAHVLNSQRESGQRFDTPLVGQAYALTGGPALEAGSGSDDPEGGELDYAWDLDNDGAFDDGTAQSVPSPPALRTAGLKTVRLRVTDAHGATDSETLTYRVNRQPVPSFIFSPETPKVGEQIQFSSTSSDPDGEDTEDELAYSWDLDGDNTFGGAGETGPDPTHTFDSAGDKIVKLRVTDTGGITREATRTVSVQLSAPDASFGFSPGSPLPGQAVTFTSSSTPTAGKQITNIEWDFDYTGTFTPDASGGSVRHAFPSAGAKTVAIKATEGPAGGFDIETGTVVVNAPPVAGFTVSDATPVTGQIVTLSSTSSDPDGPLTSQNWDLDDDGQFDDAEGPAVNGTFASPGTYVLRLRVSDGKGASSTTAAQLTVTQAPNPPSARSESSGLEVTPSLLSVVVTIRGSLSGRSTRVTRFSVRAPRGARISIRCRGAGCPKAYRKLRRWQRSLRIVRAKARANRWTRTLRSRGRKLKRLVARARRGELVKISRGSTIRFRRLERRLRRGGRIIVKVTRDGFIGKWTVFRMRSRRAPSRTDSCLQPGRNRATDCPDS